MLVVIVSSGGWAGPRRWQWWMDGGGGKKACDVAVMNNQIWHAVVHGPFGCHYYAINCLTLNAIMAQLATASVSMCSQALGSIFEACNYFFFIYYMQIRVLNYA